MSTEPHGTDPHPTFTFEPGAKLSDRRVSISVSSFKTVPLAPVECSRKSFPRSFPKELSVPCPTFAFGSGGHQIQALVPSPS